MKFKSMVLSASALSLVLATSATTALAAPYSVVFDFGNLVNGSYTNIAGNVAGDVTPVGPLVITTFGGATATGLTNGPIGGGSTNYLLLTGSTTGPSYVDIATTIQPNSGFRFDLREVGFRRASNTSFPTQLDNSNQLSSYGTQHVADNGVYPVGDPPTTAVLQYNVFSISTGKLTVDFDGSSNLGIATFLSGQTAGFNSFVSDVTETFVFRLYLPQNAVLAFSEISFAGDAQPIPEPSTYALMALGLLTVGSMSRRRSNVFVA